MTPEERALQLYPAITHGKGGHPCGHCVDLIAQALREHGNERLEEAQDAARSYKDIVISNAIRALKDTDK